jgi:hypothetical protein
MFAGFWPNVTEGAEKEFADKFNAVPKVIFSKTLEQHLGASGMRGGSSGAALSRKWQR